MTSSNKYAVQTKNTMGVIEEEDGGDHTLTEEKIDSDGNKRKPRKVSVLFLSKTVKPKTIEFSTIGRYQPPEINQDDDDPSPEEIDSHSSQKLNKNPDPMTPDKRDDEERMALKMHEELKVIKPF